MAVMVRRSAWRGSKSVDARTISSPTFQPAAFRTCIEVAPAAAVLDSFDQVLVWLPCRFRVPPMSMMPRSTLSVVPPTPLMSSSLTLLVKVMVALRVWGDFSVPISNSPCNMIHCGGEFHIGVVREAQLAVDGQTTKRWRTDVQAHFRNSDTPVLSLQLCPRIVLDLPRILLV